MKGPSGIHGGAEKRLARRACDARYYDSGSASKFHVHREGPSGMGRIGDAGPSQARVLLVKPGEPRFSLFRREWDQDMKANHHVLVIDGHAGEVQMVRDVLEPAGLQVHSRSDGASGVEAFFNLHPDLVLIDSRLSDVDGVQVSRLLKRTEQGRITPLIMMTGASPERRKRTRELSANGCVLNLQKPLAPKALIDALLLFLPHALQFPEPKGAESSSLDEPSASASAPQAAGGHGDLSSRKAASRETPDDSGSTSR